MKTGDREGEGEYFKKNSRLDVKFKGKGWRKKSILGNLENFTNEK